MTPIEIISIILGVGILTIIYFIYTTRKLKEKLIERNQEIEEQQKTIDKGYSTTYTLGKSSVRGGLMELMGDFALLVDYDQLAVIASATSQFSLDVIGIVEKDDNDEGGKGKARVDFIEFKSGKFDKDKTIHKNDVWDLSRAEKILKKLVDEKKVNYIIKEVNLPEWFDPALSNRDDALPIRNQEEEEKRKLKKVTAKEME